MHKIIAALALTFALLSLASAHGGEAGTGLHPAAAILTM
jgi:hypothetical protein